MRSLYASKLHVCTHPHQRIPEAALDERSCLAIRIARPVCTAVREERTTVDSCRVPALLLFSKSFLTVPLNEKFAKMHHEIGQ